ncbi:uncharacterized protein LOC124262446 [Haliotis rubra]|uniref:uncharacterized protein LOC124262446 n=1 Tax=Haliotis rubra TaxID=36100 RepID=UPI001EE55F02|nr:uncharacterized protein LOC124262446 [Haliotis rubra]XP_046552891.1 uncharacterized protein LOC124262446 [Haliotis rubra]XP_046552892.1 uncharacterized protein LOC124262446 [Haliotis rubra]XP_046552893.1 uncharacterized protein LOC124262446 [Haliotis rubra]XP_046552894.1 uncharacterized protein LOC124262446 [Haliotis rubra]XP_046552895.1 uncharacterized protein LOC124262446 [Haliotis rubra]XP_046552896.1 uncharacterized protein LOC124262446 [Haliotis rubra]XP_046552897.1 uncharacterized p
MGSRGDKVTFKAQNDMNIEREYGQNVTVNMENNNGSPKQISFSSSITDRRESSQPARVDNMMQRQFSRQTSNPDRDVCVVLPKRLNSTIDNTTSVEPLLNQKNLHRQLSQSPDKSRDRSKYPTPCFIRQISKNTSRVIKIVVIVSLLLNLLLIPSLATVVTLLFRDTCSAPPTPGLDVTDSLCFPCGEAGIPGVPGALRTKNGFCCGSKNDVDLQRILRQRVLQSTAALVHSRTPCTAQGGHDVKNKGPTRKYFKKTAAHLLVDVKATQTAKSIKWMTKSSGGIAFIQGGLTVRNSTIRVKKAGIYRIHSHFSFDTFTNALGYTRYIQDHFIYKLSSGEKSIIHLVKTVLEKRRYESSDVSVGVVSLRDGDEIGVGINKFRYLYNMEVANTLDIEKIG